LVEAEEKEEEEFMRSAKRTQQRPLTAHTERTNPVRASSPKKFKMLKELARLN
jgi:hypothetical protein